jgi:IstB-like ATP binding protein
MDTHDHLIALLSRLKLTALRDQLDNLIDEAGRSELTIREALTMFCERELARRDQRRVDMAFGLARFPFVRDHALSQAEAPDRRRTRLSAIRARCRAPVLPARQPPL